MKPRKAAFLDRDGVINEDRSYVHRWEDFVFLPRAIEAMRVLQERGYALVVVTNQSGIARGYYTEDAYHQLTQTMIGYLADQGVFLEGVYHCPHHPKGNIPAYTMPCDCRKPASGLFLQAQANGEFDMTQSLMVGDKPSDIEAAKKAGVGATYRIVSDNLESLHTSNDFNVTSKVYLSLWDVVQSL